MRQEKPLSFLVYYYGTTADANNEQEEDPTHDDCDR